MVARVVRANFSRSGRQTGCLVRGTVKSEYDPVLTRSALEFLSGLHRQFSGKINEILNQRAYLQTLIDAEGLPQFCVATSEIRVAEWTVAKGTGLLRETRVEIKGPATPEVIAEASYSDADAFVADFEDSLAPNWDNVIAGQVGLRNLIHGCHNCGRKSPLPLQVILRPRGWHLFERNILIDGEAIPAALVDFGLYFFHNAEKLIECDSAIWFCLPKLENHNEAQLWAEIFAYSENELGLERGSVHATILIETVPAAFEMHEILYVMQDYAVALSVGNWDYIFSLIKTLRARSQCVMPDRDLITPDRHCLQSLARLLRDTCMRRGALGMLRTTEVRLKARRLNGNGACAAVRPDLVQRINHAWPRPRLQGPAVAAPAVSAGDLLLMPGGRISESGVTENISLAVRYIAAWLDGQGVIAHKAEQADVSFAETARAQLWHWIHHPKGILCDGRRVTAELVDDMIDAELRRLQSARHDQATAMPDYQSAAVLLRQLIHSDTLAGFFTVVAYDALN